MPVRRMSSDDAAAVARLCGELGYPSQTADILRRLAAIVGAEDHGTFVATSPEGHVLGWIHVRGVTLLQVDPFAEIGGLVVDNHVRGRGVGRELMVEVERWVRERGYGEVWLRSNTARTGAHDFYRRLGYEAVKTSYTFRKSLAKGNA